MKEIPLTQGRVALVDDQDHKLVSRIKWHANKSPRGIYYARACLGKVASHSHKRRHLAMHRYILGYPPQMIDHRNGNGLDNQRHNLRLSSNNHNQANRRVRTIRGSSPFKGVSRHVFRNGRLRWQAFIGYHGKVLYIGEYKTALEGAFAYDRKAVELFGEFACLNFPERFQGRDSNPQGLSSTRT